MNRRLQLLVLLAVAALPGRRMAFAENIDPANQGLQYAYGENVGWINFKPSQGPGVTVTSTAVTGFAWGENIGWINLNPVGGGVMNDGNGNLSGFAWGENVGWINFAPTGAGVSIALDGRFLGKAWAENVGWISFNGTGAVPFGVQTSWKLKIGAPTMNTWSMGITLALLAAGSVYRLSRARRRAPLPG